MEKEIFDLKHDLIAMKNQLEEREQQLETLEKEKTHSEHKAIRLEAELDGRKAEEAEVADHNGLVVIRDGKSKKKGKR